MATFYVRPRSEAGYGNGDGKSYVNAWNGMQAVDWNAIGAGNPSTLWVCGTQLRPTTGVLAVFVEWEYSAQSTDDSFARALATIVGTNGKHHSADSVRELENVP